MPFAASNGRDLLAFARESLPLFTWVARERAAGNLRGVILCEPTSPGEGEGAALSAHEGIVVVTAPRALRDVPRAAIFELARAAGTVYGDLHSPALREAAAVVNAIGGPSRIHEVSADLAAAQASRAPVAWLHPPLDRRVIVRALHPGQPAPAPSDTRAMASQVPEASASRRAPFTPAAVHADETRWSHQAVLAHLASIPERDRPAALERLRRIPRDGAVLTAGGCAGSGVCVRACPTSALRLARTRDIFTLDVDTAACIECGACVRFCPENALHLEPSRATWADIEQRRLRVGSVRACARCAMPHGRVGELCAVCEFRTAHPTGVRLPPGFVRPRDRSHR